MWCSDPCGGHAEGSATRLGRCPHPAASLSSCRSTLPWSSWSGTDSCAGTTVTMLLIRLTTLQRIDWRVAPQTVEVGIDIVCAQRGKAVTAPHAAAGWSEHASMRRHLAAMSSSERGLMEGCSVTVAPASITSATSARASVHVHKGGLCSAAAVSRYTGLRAVRGMPRALSAAVVTAMVLSSEPLATAAGSRSLVHSHSMRQMLGITGVTL
jgi:hypothetical protein